MAQPFVGEIRIFAGSFPPAGWMFCDGAPLPISENDVLFTLLGTTYGGDGEETFNLPDLRGRLPIHQGNGFILGENGGSEEVTITTQQMPAHSHPLIGSNDIANTPNPGDSILARSGQVNMFLNTDPNTPMSAQAITPTGGSQPHTNMQPYTGLNYIISLFGLFPNRQ